MGVQGNIEGLVAGGIIDVYPNPAKDEVNVQGMTEQSTIQLIGFDGRVIHKTTSSIGTTRISLANLPAGLYIVRVQNPTQGTMTRKLIIE